MIAIPPYLILIPFGVFLLVIIFLTGVNFKHLFATGSATFVSFSATLLFMLYLFVILTAVYYLLAQINWQAPLQIWDGSWFVSSGSDFDL